MKIAFIGLGNMGNPMCRNLLKNGHELRVHDIVPDLVRKLSAEKGVDAAGSIAECVRGAEQVVTMLPSSPHVRTVYLGPEGILTRVASGTRLVDCSTIDPLTAREVAFEAKAKGCTLLDAPVS